MCCGNCRFAAVKQDEMNFASVFYYKFTRLSFLSVKSLVRTTFVYGFVY